MSEHARIPADNPAGYRDLYRQPIKDIALSGAILFAVQDYTYEEILEFAHLRYGAEYVKLELGPGKSLNPWLSIGLNAKADPTADICVNLNGGIPLPDESVDHICSNQTLEHLLKGRQIFFWNEMWRVLKPGGTMEHWVPHFLSPSQDGDPTHHTPYTETSIQYYCQRPDGAPFVEVFSDYGIECNFEIVKHEVRRYIDIHFELRKP